MHSPNRQESQSTWSTASQLAEMGFCERKLLLKHRHGPRTSPYRLRAQKAGTGEHQRFLLSAFRENATVKSSLHPRHSQRPRTPQSQLQWLLGILRHFLHKMTRWRL